MNHFNDRCEEFDRGDLSSVLSKTAGAFGLNVIPAQTMQSVKRQSIYLLSSVRLLLTLTGRVNGIKFGS